MGMGVGGWVRRAWDLERVVHGVTYTHGMKGDRSPGCPQGSPAFHFTQVSVKWIVTLCASGHNSCFWTMGHDCGDPILLRGIGLSHAWVSRPQGDLEVAVLMTLATISPSRLGCGSHHGSLVTLVTMAWRPKRGPGFNYSPAAQLISLRLHPTISKRAFGRVVKKVHEKDQHDVFVMYVEHGNFLQILTCILGGAGLCAGIFPGPHL